MGWTQLPITNGAHAHAPMNSTGSFPKPNAMQQPGGPQMRNGASNLQSVWHASTTTTVNEWYTAVVIAPSTPIIRTKRPCTWRACTSTTNWNEYHWLAAAESEYQHHATSSTSGTSTHEASSSGVADSSATDATNVAEHMDFLAVVVIVL